MTPRFTDIEVASRVNCGQKGLYTARVTLRFDGVRYERWFSLNTCYVLNRKETEWLKVQGYVIREILGQLLAAIREGRCVVYEHDAWGKEREIGLRWHTVWAWDRIIEGMERRHAELSATRRAG